MTKKHLPQTRPAPIQPPKTWKYDIFLSFRGKDTRRGFSNYLYIALNIRRFRVFRDDEDLPRGEVISRELIQAIQNSKFAIVILSENYASSSWCLDELQHILDSRENLNQKVFPIFYYVNPSDVRDQKGSFDEAFKRHQFQKDPLKVQQWRKSLTDVTALAGFDSRHYRHETDLIDRVVGELRVQLHPELNHGNDDVGDPLVPNIVSIPNMSGSEHTSAEEIINELSLIPDLTVNELVQIYILLTENERQYESFKALPTRFRKLWISIQIKRYHIPSML